MLSLLAALGSVPARRVWRRRILADLVDYPGVTSLRVTSLPNWRFGRGMILVRHDLCRRGKPVFKERNGSRIVPQVELESAWQGGARSVNSGHRPNGPGEHSPGLRPQADAPGEKSPDRRRPEGPRLPGAPLPARRNLFLVCRDVRLDCRNLTLSCGAISLFDER